MGSRAWFFLACAILIPWQVWHIASHPQFLRPPLPIGDGPDYESIGYSLSIGKGFAFAWDDPEWKAPYLADAAAHEYNQLHREEAAGPTTLRPPLLPVVISMVFRIIGRSENAFAAVRCISALAIASTGALAVLLAFQLTNKFALRWWVSHLAATFTLLIAFLDQNTRTYAVDFLTEPMAELLTTIFLFVALSIDNASRPIMKIVALSVLMALMIATRSMVVFWLPLVTVVLLLSLTSKQKYQSLLFFILVLLFLSPWWIRNCRQLESFMPMGAQGAVSILGGYSDEALADGGNWHAEAELRLKQRLNNLPISREWTKLEWEKQMSTGAAIETKNWLRQHYRDMPYLVALRLKSHWNPYVGKSLLWRFGMILGAIALLTNRRRESYWMLGLPIVSSLTVMCLYETGGRFLVPLYGLLYALAGIGGAFILQAAGLAISLGGKPRAIESHEA